MFKKELDYIIKIAREKGEMLDSNLSEKKRKVYRYAVQTRDKFFAFFEKQSFLAEAIVESIIVEYLRLKCSFRSLVRKMIEALLQNRLFIAVARFVQKVFWVCAGIAIYAGVLIATQKDGYERVTDVLKHLFPWMW